MSWFLRRFFFTSVRINKWQLNLFGLVCLSAGLVLGTYLTLSGVAKIFATSSWVQTDWSGGVGNSTTNQYASASNIDTATAGQFSLSATGNWSADYSAWQYRKKVTFDNTDANLGGTSEALTNFPVLVKLDSGSDIDYSKTQDAGQDIRFTDSDGTALSYEIEKWDEAGTSYVWVKVPSIDINSNTDYMYMYYGNTGASSAQNAADVWDSSYKAVFHLKETSGTTVTDSTSTGLTGNKVGASNPAPTTSGYIDGAQLFNGTSDYIDVASGYTSTILGLNNYTVDFWIKPTAGALSGSKVLLDAVNCGSLCFGSQFNGTTGLYWWSGGATYRTYSGLSFAADTWYHIALVRTGSGDSGSLYINGVRKSTYSGSLGAVSGSNSTLRIGQYQSGGYYTGGVFDEIRLSSTNRSEAWVLATYHTETDDYLAFESEAGKYAASGTLTSGIFDSGFASDWGTLSFTTSGSGTVTVKARTDSSSDMSGATAWASCNSISSGTDLTSTNCVTDTRRYVQYQVVLTPSGASAPVLSDITINYSASDQQAPTTNASSVAITGLSSGDWTKTAPTITWTAGADNVGGGGLAGYCLALDAAPLGASSSLDPVTSAGVLSSLNDGITNNSTCQYIVAGTSINLSSLGLSLTTNKQYYFSIKAVDTSGNVFSGASNTYQDLVSFKYDTTAPTNVAYISCASGSFSNVLDMSFFWPASGGSASSDGEAGMLGWQYQLNSYSGTWRGTDTQGALGFEYIPATASAYTLVQGRDASAINSGNNVVYFRSVDAVGNQSTDSTVRTCNLSYGGAAPAFGGTDGVTITPTTSESNSFALSWPAATASGSNVVDSYYYMINTSPPGTLATLQSNSSTYMDNGTSRTVSTAALPNVNKGANTVYVVAIDDADTPNYSPSNYISGTFTLDSSNPDNVGSLLASDSSIKASSQWNVTLTWTAPAYQGAGNLTYLVKRSTDNVTFTQVGTSTGLSYVDNTPASTKYYYKIYAQDGADAVSSGTNAVSITPTGKWTTAPSLDSGPTVSSITTKKATISWSTSRSSDSKIAYGTSSGNYNADEVSNSSQVASHTVNLTNLKAGTTYYYVAKWTDEDGNTGTSGEKSFSTDAAPTTKDVLPKNVSLSSAIIQFTSTGASKVKIYYGKSTSFGGTKEISTSTAETTYTAELVGLDDGTKYYYKINMFDEESNEYEGTTLDLTTLPRPRISSVRIQEVRGTAQPTMLVTWLTNTEVSSIISYYPQARPEDARDEINVALTKGDHKLVLRGLLATTPYILIVKGRDKIGNEATSDRQLFTTATDTRPPAIIDLKIQGSTQTVTGSQEQQTQLVVSWNTDEPSTSQVEYGEGSGSTYSQKTQEDTNLTVNHLVIISGLSASKVYHLRSLSHDEAGNQGNSIDTVTITPKASDNAFNLVISNLTEAFGFLGGLQP